MLELSTDWANHWATISQDLVSTQGNVFSYDTSIPFRVEYDRRLPHPVKYAVHQFVDGAVRNLDQGILYPFQADGSERYSILPGMARSVGLRVDAGPIRLPIQDEPVFLQATEFEAVKDVELEVFSIKLPWTESEVKREAREDLADEVLDGLFSPSRVQEYAVQFGLSPESVQQKINVLRPLVEDRLGRITDSAIDAGVFNPRTPGLQLRMGAGNSHDGALNAAVDRFKSSCFVNGVEYLIRNHVEVSFHSSNISQIVGDLLGQTVAGQPPQWQAEYDDLVIVSRVGLTASYDVPMIDGLSRGSFSVGVQDVSSGKRRGEYFSGALNFSEIKRRDWVVGGSVMFSGVDGKSGQPDSIQTGLGVMVITPGGQ